MTRHRLTAVLTACLLSLLSVAAYTSLALESTLAAKSDEPPRSATSSPTTAAAELEWEPYTGRRFDRKPIEGEVARATVPENRAKPEGAQIELAFVRYRSTNPDPGPPIFFLAGGPGGSGVTGCSFIATHPSIDLLAHGDVIGIDQRGVGLTRPNLFEGPEFAYELPMDRAINGNDVVKAFGDAVARCGEHWKRQGIDLSSYNTVESAEDIEAVRRVLGVEKIVLYGASYGTHLGLEYLRRHPERVERALLSRVEGPDHTWKLPSTVQRQLERLAAIVAADATVGKDLPDLIGTLRHVLTELEKTPKKVTVREGRPDEASVTISKFDLQSILSQLLGGARQMETIPAAVYQLANGQWNLLAGFAVSSRRDRVESAMPIWMDCASGATADRKRRIAREARDAKNLLGDAINFPYHPSICESCDGADLGDEFRSTFECDVPTLFVSGLLDARTPPQNADDVRKGFSNHAHILLTNATHDARELSSRAYRTVVRTFLSGEKVESQTIELPPLRFHPVDTDMTGGR